MMSPAEYRELMAEEARPMIEEEISGLYAHLCRATDLERAVSNLPPRSIRALNGWLARAGCVSGVPSLIHGLLLDEAAQRFMKANRDEEVAL